MKSGRSHSWLWDSHISPKNSKWLEESLKDMDTKVSAMLKLIEEDADSFAKRAEMFYKKRPELMRMVEEFYRSYRALAERYDNLTGAIRKNVQSSRSEVSSEPSGEPTFGKRIRFRRTQGDVASLSIHNKNGNDSGIDNEGVDKSGNEREKKSVQKKKSNSSSSSSDSGSGSSSASDGESDPDCNSENDTHGSQKEKNVQLERFEAQKQEQNIMESKLKKLQEQLDNFVAENKHLESQVIKQNKFEERVTILEVENRGLVAKNTNLADALQEGSRQIKSSEQKIMQLENLIRERNEESVKLKVELESQAGCNKLLEEQIIKLKSDVPSLHTEKKSYEQQIAKLQTEVNEAMINDSYLRKAKQEVENQLTQTETKLQCLTKECISMKAELLQLQEEQVTLKSELSRRNEALEKFEEESKDLHKKEKGMSNQIKCHTDQIERLQLHVSQLEAEVLALQKLKAAIDIKLQTSETECQKHIEAEQAYFSKVHELEKDLSCLQVNKHNLDQLIVCREREIQDLQGLVSKMQKENKVLQDEIMSDLEQITSIKRELQNAHEEKNALNERVQSIKRELQNAHEEKNALNERVQSKTQELLEVHITVKLLNEQFQELQANYQSVERSHQRGMDEKIIIEEALNKKQIDLAHLQEEYDETKDNNSTKEAHIMDLENKILILEIDVLKLKDEVDRFQSKDKDNYRLFENLRSEIENLKNDNAEIICNVQVGIDEIQKLQEKLQQSHDYHASLENSNNRHIDEKAMLEVIIKNVREELSSLQMEHDELKLEVSSRSLYLVKLEAEKNSIQEQWNIIDREKLELLEVIKEQKCIHEKEIKNREMLLSNLQEKYEMDRMEKERAEIHISEIKTKIVALEELNDYFRREVSLLQEEKQALQSKVSLKLVYIKKLEDEISMHVSSKERLQMEHDTLKSEISTKNLQIQSLETEGRNVQEHLDQVAKERENIVQEKETIIQKHEEEIRQWELEQSSYESRIHTLENSLSQVEMESCKLNEMLSSYLQKIQVLGGENRSLTSDVESKNEQMTMLQKHIHCLHEEQKKSQQLLQNSVEEQLRMELSFRELQDKLEKADEHYTSLYNSHIQSVDENRNLNWVINSVREELLILQIAHDALKAEMSTKDTLFVKLEKEQKKLQKHMDDTVQEKEFLIQKHEEEVRKLNMAHDISISMIHDLRGSIAHIQLEKHHVDEVILSKSQEIQVLETQNKSLQDDIQSHHEQMAMLQKEIHCLQEEKMKSAEMLQVKSQQLLELEITIKELEKKLHKLQEYCSNLDNSCKRSIDDRTILEGVIENAREELSALQTVHDALKTEMSTKDLHILSMKEEKESILQKHEEERKKQEATQISYQSRIHELEDAFSQVQMEKHNLDGIVLSNLQQIYNLQDENKSFRDDIHSTNGQIAKLQKEIHCLQEDGKNLQQNLQAKADQLFEMQIKDKELQEKLQKSQEYCSNLDDSYKHTNEEKKALEKVIKKAKDELSSLEVEYDALKIKMSAKHLHFDMVKDELEQVVYEKERVIQMHEEDIRKWELTESSYMSMTQELQDTISQVKTEKYNLDETISSKLQEIKALQEENKSLRIDLQMSNDQRAILHKDIQCAEENGKNLWQELQTNTEKLLELEISLKELQENLQKSQEYSNSLEILHKMTIDEKNALETLVKNAHEEFSTLQMKYDVLKTKMAAKDLEIESLEAQRGSMNKDLEMMDIHVKQLVQDEERIMQTHKVESKHWELLHLDLQNKCELHVKEKEKLEDQIFKMKAELQNQEQRGDNLKIQVFQLQESNESINGELSMLKEEHKILQDKEKGLNGTVDLVNIKLSKLEVEALDMENSILSLEEKNKQLLSAKESGIHELSSLGKQIEQLQHELGLLMEEKHVLQSEVSSGFILIKKLEDEINLHVIEEEKMQEEQKKLNSENYDLKAQLHEILQRFEEIVHRLQSSSMDSHEAYERTIGERTIEASNGLGIDRLNTVVDRIIQKVQLDKDGRNTLLIQMSQKDNFIIDLQNQVSRLETEMLNLEHVGDALRHENKSFQKTLQNRDAHIEEIEEENKRLHSLMPVLQEQVDAYKKAAGIMQTRIDELLAQLLKLQNENSNLLGIIETKTEAMRIVEQENYNLKDNISAHLTQIYVIEGNILHLQELNQKLNCVIENKDIVGDKLQEHIQEAHENIYKLQKEQDILQQQARDLQQQHDELEEINQKLKCEASAGLESIQKLENNVSALHTEKTTLTQELIFQIESSKKLHHEIISLQELLEKKDFNIKRHVDLNIKLIDDLQKQMFSLGNDYDISSEVKAGLEPVAQLELVMYRVLDHLREQQNKISELSEKHQHGVATIEQLEIELVTLQENNSKLKLEVEERSMQLTKFEHKVNAIETEKRKLNSQLALWCREIGNSLNRSDRNSNDVQSLSRSLEGNNSRIKEGKAEEVIDLKEIQDMLSKLVMEKKLLGEKLLIQITEKRILNENLDFVKSHSVELDGQVQLLRKRSEKQESSLQEKESHIHILNQEKKAVAAKFEIIEHQYKSDLENMKQMQKEILDLQEYCKTLQNEMLQGRILIKEIETNISGLRTEKGLLRDEVTSSIILNEELHKLYNVKLDLEKALHLQSTELHRQEEKLQILQERMTILQEEKKQSEDRYYGKLDEMKVVEERLKQLQENINTLEVENTRVIDDILDRVKQHEAELYTLQIEKEDLYTQLINHLHHATKAEEELHTVQAISELLRKTVEGEKERSKNLETTIAELVSITTTLKEEKSKILDDYEHSKEQQNKLEVKLANLDQEKKSMQEEIFSHTKELAKLQDQITNVGLENETLKQELSVKTSKTCQLEANVNDLQNENMHLEKMLHTRVQQQDDDIQKLLETISHVYEKERALAEDLQYHLHQYKSGSKLMMELEGELLQLQGESKVLESELLGRDSLLNKVEKDLLQYQEGKVNCKQPENEHDADADALRAKLQKLQNEDMRLKAKLLVVTKQVEKLERRILVMQEENRKLVAEVEVSAQQGRHLMLALTFMKAEVKRIVHRTTNLKVEIADRNFALTAKNDNLCRLQDQIQNLQLKTGVEIEERQQRSEDPSSELASEDLSSELASLDEKVVIPQEDNVAEENRKPIVILQEDNKKQKQYLGIVAEEEPETIRQLCFSLKYLKAKNEKLEKSLRSFKVRLRIKYRNSPPTWRSCLAPWYKLSKRKIS